MAESEHEANLKALRTLAEDAGTAVRDVPQDSRAPYEGIVERLEQVLVYAGIVLAHTDPALVSDQANQALTSAFSSIRERIEAEPQTSNQFSSDVLAGLSQLPVASGQLTAQEAKDAAQTFARSSRSRLTQLNMAVSEQKGALDEVGRLIKASQEELAQLVGKRKTEADQLVEETKGKLADLEQRIETTLTEQGEVFRTGQDERAEQYGETVTNFEQRLDVVVNEAGARVEQLLQGIERKDKDASDMLGAIGVAGTAGRWAEEAKEQRKVSNAWRVVTVIVVVLAVAMGLLAARANSVDDPAFVSKILISLALGGLAAYTARQSGRHRAREERARTLELELAAFGPFIEPLPDEKQQEERQKMVGKTFGQRPTEAELDGGPSLLGITRRSTADSSGGLDA